MQNKLYLLLVIIITNYSLAAGGIPATEDKRSAGQPITAILQGKGWYGFGIPGFGTSWLGNDIILSCPGEGEIQITSVKDPLQPQVLGHLEVGFVGGIARLKDSLFIAGPRGIDYLLDFSNPSKPVKTGIGWQLPKDVKIEGQLDFRGFIPGPELKWIAAINPYSQQVVWIWDFKDPNKPTFISKLDVNEKGGIFGTFEFLNGICCLNINMQEGSRVLLIDISDIKKPSEKGLLVSKEDMLILSALDKSHALVGKVYKRGNNTKYSKLEIWSIGSTLEECKVISEYIPSDKFPYINSASWDEKNREAYIALGRHFGTQDAVYYWSEGNTKTGTCTMEVLKMDDSWNMTSKQSLPSWGVSRFTKALLSPDKKTLALADYNYGVWLLKKNSQDRWEKISGFMTPAEGHWAVWDVERPYVYAFPTFGSQMRIFNCDNIEAPKETSQFWLENWTYAEPVAIPGYVLVPQMRQISVVDVSTPTSPVIKDVWTGKISPEDTFFTSSCRVAKSSDNSLLFCMWEGGRKWGETEAWIDVKKYENGGFAQLSRIQVRPSSKIRAFPPRIIVDKNHLYVNDVAFGTISKWNIAENGTITKVSEFSTSAFSLNKDFNMDYPGVFAEKDGIVYLIQSGDRKRQEPMVFIIDTNEVPFKHTATYSSPLKSYIMDAKIIKGYLVIEEYWGNAFVFKLVDNGKNVELCSKFSVGEMAWTLGDIKNNLIAWPSLYNLNIVKVK